MTAAPSEVIVEFDVPARMRDGVTLRANVYRAQASGPQPVLLARTPYGKDVPLVLEWLDPVQTARRGFVVVIQDTRGRFASEGEWEPFRFERQDGYDTVEWAANLPGSNGCVGMYGFSYWGNSQWLAAIERPPSLVAIAPGMTWSEPMDGLFGRGGAVELGVAVPWSLEHGIDYLARHEGGADDIARHVDAVIDEHDSVSEQGYWDIPVREMAVLRRHGLSNVGLMRAVGDPGFIDSCRVTGSYDQVEIPSFHIAGWHDIFLQGTLDNYEAMVRLGREARLIVGPWTHASYADPIGQQLYGMRASKTGVAVHAHGDVNDLQLAWLRRHLVPDATIVLPEAPVRIFVMGRNAWRDEASWPPPNAVSERWFLHTGGGLERTPSGAGSSHSEFAYDPMDPVPTVGGHTVMSPGYPAGPIDQRRVEARDDVLVFTSELLEADLEVTGRLRAVLHAESSAPSTDWVVRLCDVHPDGRSFALCDGILRVDDGAEGSRCYEIDLWSTSNVFLRGHRLRVHVTSSSFPRWDRNLNTGNQRDGHHEVARQRVFHDADRPSYVELPAVR